MKKTCVICSGIFIGRVGSKFCSPECKRTDSRNKSRARYNITEVIHKCRMCGVEFRTHSKQVVFCSRVCAKKHKYPNNNYYPFFRMRFSILSRDGFKCMYCGRGVVDGIKLEIDHIIPKSKGGEDKESNYVTACNECNVGKSNRI